MKALRAWSRVFVHTSPQGEPCGPVLPAELHALAASLPADSLACFACNARLEHPSADVLRSIRYCEEQTHRRSPTRDFANIMDAGRIDAAHRRAKTRARHEAEDARQVRIFDPLKPATSTGARRRRGERL